MAVSEIEKLEARYNENPEGRYFAPLADAYRKAGRADDAIMLVEHGLTKHPDYLSAHIVLARCFLDKKDDTSALAAFHKVLALDSENVIALKALAEVAERMGKPDDARRWLTRLLNVDATNAEAEEDLARLGGPLAEAAAPAEVEAAPVLSFSDFTEPEPPATPPAPEPVPVAVQPPTTEVAAVAVAEVAPPADLAEMPTLSMEPVSPASPPPSPPLGLEPMEFEPPPEEPAPVSVGGDVVPFDDKLEWGAGERQSRAIHAEDIAEAEARHEATAAAIEFSGGTGDGQQHVSSEHLRLESPVEEFAAAPPAPPSADLPLIMPEEVTPAEELRRPSTKQVETVSPEPAVADASPHAPLLTETMGDLYLRQGFRAEAADVYRRVLAERPDDAVLRAKLAQVEAPPPALSASALGTEAVGSWLRRIAHATLGMRASAPPPAPPEGQAPMEAAFAAPEPVPVAAPEGEAPLPGEPARPATSQFSLDQIFGAPPAPAGDAAAAAPAAPPPASLGSSFDEFFGGPGSDAESARPREAQAPRPSEDDLSAFTAWLHGLKK